MSTDSSSFAPSLTTFRTQSTALHDILKIITPEQIDAPSPAGAPGVWTVRENVVHLWESDLAAIHRMRRIIAEELPLLIAYDETHFVQRLDYRTADLALVAESFRLGRLLMADSLEHALRTHGPSVFDRAGVHNQRGTVTLGQFVSIYIDHVNHHLRIVREKRRLLGCPMAD